MTILGNIWTEWVTPEQLVKAAKPVGVSKDGLNINWMDQSKFNSAEATLNPPGTPEAVLNSTTIASPVGTRRYSSLYWRKKFEASLEKIGELNQTISTMNETTPELETVPNLMPYRKVVPKNKNKSLTKKHGTLKSTDVLKLAQDRQVAEEELEARRVKKKQEKENLKINYIGCKGKCQCEKGQKECTALNLKQCPVCLNVLKTQCNKKDCKGEDGKPPRMITVAAKSLKTKSKGKVNWSDEDSVDEESEDPENGMETDGSDMSDEEFFANESSTASKAKNCILFTF